jgi:endonuclease YncB( thermonuclease family)
MTAGATISKRTSAWTVVPLVFAGLSAIAAPWPAIAQPAAEGGPDSPCVLENGETAKVAEVVDGDTLSLADGRQVRLAEIEAPKVYSVRAGAEIAPMAKAARDALERLVRGGRIDLQFGEIRSDRYGRLLAQAFLDGGTWLQEEMVRAGLARVRPFAGTPPCLDSLLAREREARDEARGLWQSTEFAVISANDSSLIERIGLYVIVEGRVVSVGRGNRLDFLNFGHIWRRDFTVMVEAPVSERLTEMGLSVEALAGRQVRVRGVIEESGGPAIRLNHPSEIEVPGDD